MVTTISKISRRVPAILAGLVVGMSPALASITIDGKYDGSAPYDLELSVDFTFEDQTYGGSSSGTGFMALGTQANGNQVLYYSVPKQYVDLSYGDGAIGWDDYAHNGPNDSGHSFGELKGSDKLEFKTAAGDKVKVELKGKFSSDNDIVVTATDSFSYNLRFDACGGVQTPANADCWSDTTAENYNGTYKDDSPLLTAGSDYTDDSDANYLNSVNSDWIFDVGYEIEFEAGTFDNTDWANGDIAKLFMEQTFKGHGDHGKDEIEFVAFFGGHASPSKLQISDVCIEGESDDCPIIDPPCKVDCGGEVPVPAPLWLMLVGLYGIYRSRK